MKNPDPHPLRQQAEQKLRERKERAAQALSEADARATLHELQVHQIELEMQNDELQRAQVEAREVADKYTGLFDFAPIGYFVLDRHDVIREVNLAGAVLLGLDRQRVVGQPFGRFVVPDARTEFGGFLCDVRSDDSKRSCEARLLKHGHGTGDVLVEGVAAGAGEGQTCLLAMQDITERRRMEDTLRFLARCGSSPSSEDFFQALACFLAQSLGMDYVCIDQLQGDLLAARTVAVYFDGKFEDNVTYTLRDTPCGDVLEKKICCFPRDVRQLFPKDAVLQGMSAESYAGTILWGFQGNPIGLIAVIGRQPLSHPALTEAILQLVAVRAAGELERRRAEDELRASNAILTRFNAAMVDRELRMVLLKQEINALCVQAGLPPRYALESERKEGH